MLSAAIFAVRRWIERIASRRSPIQQWGRAELEHRDPRHIDRKIATRRLEEAIATGLPEEIDRNGSLHLEATADERLEAAIDAARKHSGDVTTFEELTDRASADSTPRLDADRTEPTRAESAEEL